MRTRKQLLVFMNLIILPLLLIGISAAAIDPDTVVAYWTFDEGNGDEAADSSGNGNNGALMNDPKWVDGKFGSAIEFDGADDVVDCGNDANLDPDALTVVAWVMALRPNPEGRVVNKMNDGDLGYFLMVSGTSLRAFIHSETFVEFSGPLGGTVPDTWHHIAVTFDGKKVIIYDNASEIASKDLDGVLRKNAQTVYIGGEKGTGRMYGGVADEVAVFSVALDENDLKIIMDKGLEVAIRGAAVSATGKLTTTWATVKTQ